MPSAERVGSASPIQIGSSPVRSTSHGVRVKGEVNSSTPAAPSTRPVSPSVSRSTSDTSSTRPDPKSPGARPSEQPPPYQPSSIKISKEVSRLQELVSESSAEAVQVVLRDNVDKFLAQDDENNIVPLDEHVSFILRAGLSAASEDVKVAVLSSDQGKKLRVTTLAEATSFDIQEYVPVSVLDPILRDRLKSVPAMQLIQWLAEADRLGYNADDIIENDDESIVLPNLPSRHEHDIEMTDAPPVQPARGPMTAPLSCRTCKARFSSSSGYNYHISKRICEKKCPPGGYKSLCNNCFQGFTSSGGKNYHDMNNCCRDNVARATPIGNSTSPSAQLQQEAQAPAVRPAAPNSLSYYSAQMSSLLNPAPQQQQGQQQQQPQPSMRTALPSYSQPQPQAQPPQPISRAPVYTPQQNTQGPAPLPSSSSSSRFVSETPSQSGSTRKQHYASSPEVRMTPESLPPDQYARLNIELDAVDAKHDADVASVESDLNMSPAAKAQRLTSLKNGQASKKSQIRKKFGVTLRLRDKDKKAMKAKGLTPTYNRSSSSQNGAPSSHYLDPKYTGSMMNSSPLVNTTLASTIETPQSKTQLATISTPQSQPQQPATVSTPQSHQQAPVPIRQSSGFTPLNRPGYNPPLVNSRSASAENSNKRRRSSESPAPDHARRETSASRRETITVISSDEEADEHNRYEEESSVLSDSVHRLERRGSLKAKRGGRREFNIPRPVQA